jgi:hypothetical protein
MKHHSKSQTLSTGQAGFETPTVASATSEMRGRRDSRKDNMADFQFFCGIHQYGWSITVEGHNPGCFYCVEQEPRHSDVIVGAIREHVDVMRNANGDRFGYGRLNELVTELERALTTQQIEDVVKQHV